MPHVHLILQGVVLGAFGRLETAICPRDSPAYLYTLWAGHELIPLRPYPMTLPTVNFTLTPVHHTTMSEFTVLDSFSIT